MTELPSDFRTLSVHNDVTLGPHIGQIACFATKRVSKASLPPLVRRALSRDENNYPSRTLHLCPHCSESSASKLDHRLGSCLQHNMILTDFRAVVMVVAAVECRFQLI